MGLWSPFGSAVWSGLVSSPPSSWDLWSNLIFPSITIWLDDCHERVHEQPSLVRFDTNNFIWLGPAA
ncbi:hypothetical protein FLAG1_03478 [Fusarium langsethiae]|uniref:Uncharacterized protein n=1 Tax=Fusarium langsethiae TaxID=179993 RepID=A0A0N0V7I2_FUSLA|nr:hypothetical protein FLAG1_03478 [Fusarium langsethiae]